METNPFTPPSAKLDEAEAVDWSDPERVRRKYLAHEVKARALGLPFLAAGLVVFVLGILLSAGAMSSSSPGEALLILVLLICPGTILGAFGAKLRRLKAINKLLLISAWLAVAYVAMLLAISPQISWPTPSWLLLFVLAYIVAWPRAAVRQTIFSDRYRQIVAQTPHLRAKTPWWTFLAALVVALIPLGMVLHSAIVTSEAKQAALRNQGPQ